MLPRTFYTEHDARKRQIDTLKIFNEHVNEVVENSEYRIDFSASGLKMSLNVILGPEFPNEKPLIYVNPPILHPWLAENSNQVVGAPGLLNYTQHSDLGRVVQAIIREIKKHKPTTVADEARGGETSQQKFISVMFPELERLSIEELRELLLNPDLQDKLLSNNPLLNELETKIGELIVNIEETAQSNISMIKEMEKFKSDIVERISTVVAMKMNFEELNRRHQKLSEMYDPHRIRDALKEAAIKADEEAEDIAEEFLLGKMAPETFVLKYSEKRSLGQARKAREERLALQLAQLDKATT